ncbi:hypothetical protein Moror_3145 [Moniliophthora roreri MCA 2997]|uniref:Uncharacterized protein n=1 Tax=Moniliophthora roreri (strain MCA 2997) TaxID=1381753 RepID=V2X7X4_MONRO|nr:hypothetical protein Moror_3145 [Moniliophthora roreri MCA 2997]
MLSSYSRCSVVVAETDLVLLQESFRVSTRRSVSTNMLSVDAHVEESILWLDISYQTSEKNLPSDTYLPVFGAYTWLTRIAQISHGL